MRNQPAAPTLLSSLWSTPFYLFARVRNAALLASYDQRLPEEPHYVRREIMSRVLQLPATIPPQSTEGDAKGETKVRQVRPARAGDIANQQTAEQLALRIWAATVAEKVLSAMSALMAMEILDVR